MKRLIPRLLFLLLLAAAAAPAGPRAGAARAQGRVWTGVRSQNFFVAGEAREKDLRRVAVRLEEYRAAFSRLLSPEHFDAGVPTTVVVFPDDSAYNPFKPFLGGRRARGVAGYFQPGADVNYITVALDPDFELDTLLHEYTHLLVNNHFRGAPLWLKEGLAEFYSTARLSGDRRRVTLGETPGRRARELRGRAPIPLATLFAVDQSSPYYHEPAQRGLFYAQSWALVHYLLMSGGGGERRDGLDRFTSMLAEGATAEQALRGAFGLGVAEAAAGLAEYVRAGRYRSSTELFERPLDFDSQLRAGALAEPEGLALLGDLLLHTDRETEAEGYLLRALALDPGNAAARVSLGVLRLRQNRAAEARDELRKAAALAPENYLARYHLAEALNRDDAHGASGQPSIRDFEERTEAIRAELRRAIELAPGFIEPYKLLATVEMERGDRPEEAAAVLTRASALAPRRDDLTLLHAHARLLAGRFDDARKLAEPVARRAADPRLREQAGTLLARVEARRELAARLREQEEEARAESEAAPAQPCDVPSRGGPQYKRLRFEGAQVCGRLSEIECDEAGVVFRVETDAGATLRLRAEDLRAVRFVTYTTAVKTGRISCGRRETADRALVTYRPRRDERASTDGEAVAVEFVPEDWNR